MTLRIESYMTRKIAWIWSSAFSLFMLAMFSTMLIDGIGSLGKLMQEGYWDFREASFSALGMFKGTVFVGSVALVIALPFGFGSAICLSEVLSGKARAFFKITIELMAGIPSVVYGLLGVSILSPIMGSINHFFGGFGGDSHLTAGILLSIMVMPTLITFADDALRCVPHSLREEALGLGLNHLQTVLYAVIPAAKPGLMSATMLALGRALGETIAVFLVIGRSDQPFHWHDLTLSSLFSPGQTLTSKLGGPEIAIAYGDPQHWSALIGLGICLWIFVGLIAYTSEILTHTMEKKL